MAFVIEAPVPRLLLKEVPNAAGGSFLAEDLYQGTSLLAR